MLEILNGAVMPVMLAFCGAVLAFETRLHRILSPRRFFRDLKESAAGSGTSPWRAMCTALAGTLGVGNVAGVATAVTAGGPGAVMWMWIGALVSMSVKYGEVVLAVKYRRSDGVRHYGGSMYTMRDGMRKYIKRGSGVLGGVFAALCIVNSLVMGNVIQSGSACAVFPDLPKYLVGSLLAVGVVAVAVGGKEKITSFMSSLIPVLSAVYIILSLTVIFMNLRLLPEIFGDILKGAFTVKGVTGGTVGLGMREALRYGVTRGIFSNEAGCGTAPTAHAASDVKSPHHQGCFGIFEVIADTLVLCSMTAFVILIYEKKNTLTGLDGVPLTLSAFGDVLGGGAYCAIGVSVILFAYATLAAGLYYANTAIGYFTESKLPCAVYAAVSSVLAFSGRLINTGVAWALADLTVGVMTVVNVTVLLVMGREVPEEARKKR